MKRSQLNLYEMVMGYSMAWFDEALNNHPIASAIVTALIIDRFIW